MGMLSLNTAINNIILPFPAHYDPPSFPYPPGKHPEELRLLWECWGESWEDIADPLGVELTTEVVATLCLTFFRLEKLGVGFDPRFSDQMTRIARGWDDEDGDRGY
ncbi:MAG: hypothetical protein AAF078_06265 [Planctomycetota bacterium]